MIGTPTRLALGVPDPEFYRFDSSVESRRAEFIEEVSNHIAVGLSKADWNNICTTALAPVQPYSP